MPHNWQDDTASGYTISTRVPYEDSASIFKQDCTKRETDATLSFFGLYQDNTESTEQNIGEPSSDLGFPSLWYSGLFDVPESRTSTLQFNKPPHTPSLQNSDASESALHFRQVSRTSPKPVARDTTDFSKCENLTHSKGGTDSGMALEPSPQSMNTPRTSSSSTMDPRVPELLLVDTDLWSKFHEQGNEMIITKSGRCLFPCLRFKAVNLDPAAIYTIYLDFELIDHRRFKFEGGRWRANNTNTNQDGDPCGTVSALAKESYTHPDKYQTGAHWMKGTIFFDKAKLSNSRESAARSAKKASSIKSAVGNSHHIFHMSSFRKYRPRVHLIQRGAQSNAVASSTTYTFSQTTFIAVTHYQNSKVNELKKGFNPHARGFRGSAGMPLSLPMPTKKRPSRSVLRSKRTQNLKRRYCERDTSESDADADADGDETDTEQSSDNNDDFDSDISTLPEMVRTSSSEDSEKSTTSLCRLNKDNRAMIRISLSKGKIDATWIEGESSPPQRSRQLQREAPSTLCGPPPLRSLASRTQLDLKTIQLTSANSTSAVKNTEHKQRIPKIRRLESSSSSVRSSTSASTKSSSRCSVTSKRGRRPGNEPQTIAPECDIQKKFTQVSTSHATSPSMEQQQNDAQNEPDVSSLHHDPPSAPPLSWYQQFIYWDQPSQALSHQTIQRPAMPNTTQSCAESGSCLMLPFSVDKNLEYVMLQRPPPQMHPLSQTTLSEALSDPNVDTARSVALDATNANSPFEPHTPLFRGGTRHAHSQVRIQMEEGSASSQAHSNPTTTFKTILESRTLMSTTSDIALLPSSEGLTNAHLEHALRENLRLKAFIRARY
ncbi:T-box transcription factor tbx21, partial [Mortierella alpina]